MTFKLSDTLHYKTIQTIPTTQWRRQDFFLGGLGPFPLPSFSSLPSLSPPLPFPSLPPSPLPLPSPQNEEADRSSDPPLPCPPLPCPPVPSLSLPLEVGPLKSS